jgi:hypothetical protein
VVFTGKRTSPASLPTIRHRPCQRVRASRLLICQPAHQLRVLLPQPADPRPACAQGGCWGRLCAPGRGDRGNGCPPGDDSRPYPRTGSAWDVILLHAAEVLKIWKERPRRFPWRTPPLSLQPVPVIARHDALPGHGLCRWDYGLEDMERITVWLLQPKGVMPPNPCTALLPAPVP